MHSTVKIENTKWTWSFYWATLFFSCLGLYFLSDAFSGFFWLFMAAYPGEQHSQSIHFHHHEVHEYWLLWPVQLLLHANSCWILLGHTTGHTIHCLFNKIDSKIRSQSQFHLILLHVKSWFKSRIISFTFQVFWMKKHSKFNKFRKNRFEIMLPIWKH